MTWVPLILFIHPQFFLWHSIRIIIQVVWHWRFAVSICFLILFVLFFAVELFLKSLDYRFFIYCLFNEPFYQWIICPPGPHTIPGLRERCPFPCPRTSTCSHMANGIPSACNKKKVWRLKIKSKFVTSKIPYLEKLIISKDNLSITHSLTQSINQSINQSSHQSINWTLDSSNFHLSIRFFFCQVNHSIFPLTLLSEIPANEPLPVSWFCNSIDAAGYFRWPKQMNPAKRDESITPHLVYITTSRFPVFRSKRRESLKEHVCGIHTSLIRNRICSTALAVEGAAAAEDELPVLNSASRSLAACSAEKPFAVDEGDRKWKSTPGRPILREIIWK